MTQYHYDLFQNWKKAPKKLRLKFFWFLNVQIHLKGDESEGKVDVIKHRTDTEKIQKMLSETIKAAPTLNLVAFGKP